MVQLSTTPDTKADGGPLWYIKSLLLLSPISVAGAGKGGPDTDTGLRHPDVPPPPKNGKVKLLIWVNLDNKIININTSFYFYKYFAYNFFVKNLTLTWVDITDSAQPCHKCREHPITQTFKERRVKVQW